MSVTLVKKFLYEEKNYGKDIDDMAALFRQLHRHRTDKQKVINNLITSSDSWSSIRDLHPKLEALSARDDLVHKKARLQSDSSVIIKYKEY